MRRAVCPRCGSANIHHYTDAHVVCSAVVSRESVRLIERHIIEYDECFFECADCGSRPTEAELIAPSVKPMFLHKRPSFVDALGTLVAMR